MKVLGAILLLTSLVCAQFAGPKAFPSAVGYGAYAARTDFKNLTIVTVTNTNDAGAGSFREAITSGNNRLVIIQTSGVVALASDLTVTSTGIYIAGQTSPGGFCVHAADCNRFKWDDPSDVIMRAFAISGGDDDHGTPACGTYDDALVMAGVTGGSGVVIDHMEIYHGDDETVDYNVGPGGEGKIDSTTWQWCAVFETMDDLTGGQSNHSRQWSIIPEENTHISVYRCMVGQGRSRNIKFFTYNATKSNRSRFDFQNNLIYNWGQNTMHTEDGDPISAILNLAYNYYKEGPLSTGYTYAYQWDRTSPSNTGGSLDIWFTGNRWNSAAGGTVDATYASYVDIQHADSVTQIGSAFSIPGALQLPVVSADNAYQAILDTVGVWWISEHLWNTRIKSDVENRTGGLFSSGAANWTSADLPTFTTPAMPTDTDGDHMSDTWETANGLNPSSSADQMTHEVDMYRREKTDYCNLEWYLEDLVMSWAPRESASLSGYDDHDNSGYSTYGSGY